jgi:hypothetical protein
MVTGSATLNPQPHTLNPKPSTLNPKLSTLTAAGFCVYPPTCQPSTRTSSTLTVLGFPKPSTLTSSTLTVVGFCAFGGMSKGLILNNYATSDVLATASRGAIAASILLGFPLTFEGFRYAAKGVGSRV